MYFWIIVCVVVFSAAVEASLILIEQHIIRTDKEKYKKDHAKENDARTALDHGKLITQLCKGEK